MGSFLRRSVGLVLLALLVPACGDGEGASGGGTPQSAENRAPGIVLFVPSVGSTFSLGDPVLLEAIVADADGTVVQVDFFQGSTLLGTLFAPPFQFPSTAPAEGIFGFTAVATDNAGAVTTSAPVLITVAVPGAVRNVNRPPTVTVFLPTPGSSFTDRSPVSVVVDATDPGGGVVNVEFFDGATFLGSANQPPFEFLWTATLPGIHSLRAVATDTLGAQTSSSPVTVSVTAIGKNAPAPPVVAVPPEGSLRGVFFEDPYTGWIVGEQGRIYATTDGGVTWFAQVSGTASDLNRVQFAGPSLGWIVGADGTILRTGDGGAVWRPVNSGTSSILTGLSFVSGTTGWVVGWEGTILKTTDGGASWAPQASGSGNALGAVAFATEQAGWVDGNGEILFTRDGGATWVRQPSEFPSFTGIPHVAFFSDARFLSGTQGTFVGRQNGGDVIFTTSDGGDSWTISQMHADFADWRGVAFGDATHLWAVGSAGLFETDRSSIAASRDGGITWADQVVPTQGPLNAVCFVNATTGWAVGENGVVLRTTNGGTTWIQLSGR